MNLSETTTSFHPPHFRGKFGENLRTKIVGGPVDDGATAMALLPQYSVLSFNGGPTKFAFQVETNTSTPHVNVLLFRSTGNTQTGVFDSSLPTTFWTGHH